MDLFYNRIMNTYRLLAVLGVVFSVFSADIASSASLLVCYNTRTKAITAEQSRCPSGTAQLSGSNLTTLFAKGVKYSACYVQSGTTSGIPSTGQLSLAMSCRGSDVVVEDSFSSSSSNNGANPALGAKAVIYSGTVPNGMQFTAQANPGLFYRFSASITCCPQ